MFKKNFIIAIFCGVNYAAAIPFHCEANLPATLQIQAIQGCSQSVAQLTNQQNNLFNKNRLVFNDTLMKSVLINNNLGGSVVNFPDGTQKQVYRSANLGGSQDCLQNVVKAGHIKTIINLYNNDYGNAQSLNKLERNGFYEASGEVYTTLLNFSVLEPHQVNSTLYKKIADIIYLVQTSPGNVLIHCLEGAHNTGVIFGVMQKCYNKIPVADVLGETSCHLPYGTSFDQQAKNTVVDIIKNYPCDMLSQK